MTRSVITKKIGGEINDYVPAIGHVLVNEKTFGLSVGDGVAIGGIPLPNLNEPNTFTHNVTFNDGATFNNSATFNDGASFNNSATFNDGASFNNSATFNDGASFNNSATFNDGASFIGSSAVPGLSLRSAVEPVYLQTAPGSVVDFYFTNGSILYFTSDATNNWTINFAFDPTHSLGLVLTPSHAITCCIFTKQGTTAYYNTAITIDGNSTNVFWSGGTAPTSGNNNGIDVYSYTIICTANNTYSVLASQVQY